MHVAAIVQARMGSERLPGKVLLDIAGESMLSRVVRRTGRSRLIDEVVVATSTSPADDVIVSAGNALGVTVTRGSENDVLGRYAESAANVGADVVVRVSADSPFVDPEVCDLVVSRFMAADPPVDYASNKLEASFPLGLDVEAFSRAALDRAARDASESHERAHVTLHIYSNPGKFRLLPVVSERDLHSWRWTVDTAEDLEFARVVYGRMGGGNEFSWREVVALLDAEPLLIEINSHVQAKDVAAG